MQISLGASFVDNCNCASFPGLSELHVVAVYQTQAWMRHEEQSHH